MKSLSLNSFFVQSDDYFTLKDRVIRSALKDEVAEGIATIDIGVEALKLARTGIKSLNSKLGNNFPSIKHLDISDNAMTLDDPIYETVFKAKARVKCYAFSIHGPKWSSVFT